MHTLTLNPHTPNNKVQERRRRIIEATGQLAAEGGMAAVRSRSVCERAGVTMGTLYRDFSSLEEVLLIGFATQFGGFGEQFPNGVAPGSNAVERIERFFTEATEAVTRDPNYGRAIVSALAAGQSKAMASLAQLTLQIAALVQSAWTGIPAVTHGSVSERDRLIAFTLERVWLSVLIGWASGIRPAESIVGEVVATAQLFIQKHD